MTQREMCAIHAKRTSASDDKHEFLAVPASAVCEHDSVTEKSSAGWTAHFMGEGEPPSRATAMRRLIESMKRQLADETDPRAAATARRAIEEAERTLRSIERER
jgi:hypothetical protein